MKRVCAALIVALFIAIGARGFPVPPYPPENCLPSVIASNNDEWLMFHHDASHTGFSTSDAPDGKNVVWVTSLGAMISSSPVVYSGRVFIGTESGKLFCLRESSGELLWSFAAGGNITDTSAVMYGNVYFCERNGTFHALDAVTGLEKWKSSAGKFCTPPTAANGKVFVGSCDGKLCAFNATMGQPLWNFTCAKPVKSSPAFAGSAVFFGSDDGFLYALNSDGKKLWAFDTKTPVRSSPAIDNNAVVFGAGSKIYAVDCNSGKLIWSNITGGQVLSSPAVAYGKVFVGSGDMNVYAYASKTGRLVWSRNTNGAVFSSPAVADGRVYVGSLDKKVYSFSANDSAKAWEYQTTSGVYSSPAVAGGKAFAASYDGRLYCFSNGLASLVLECQSSPQNVRGGENTQITIRATNSSSGAPVHGVTVILSTSLGGVFDPSYFGDTDSSGVFSTNFISPNINGIATISVNASNPQFSTCRGYLDVGISYRPMLPSRIDIEPTSVDSGGASKVTVLVIKNASDTSRAMVSLNATYGIFDAPSGITDASGNYTTIYHAVKTERMITDTLVARVEKEGYLPTVLYSVIEIKPRLFLTVAANPSVVSEGNQTYFTVFTEDSGFNVIEGAELSFSTDTGSISPDRGYSAGDGRFTGTFHAPGAASNKESTVFVNATKDNFNAGSARLSIRAVKPGTRLLTVSIGADIQDLPNGGTSSIFARVTDAATLSPVADATVLFSVSSHAGHFSKVENAGNGRYYCNFTSDAVADNTTVIVRADASRNGYFSGTASIIQRLTTGTNGLILWAAAEPAGIGYNQSSDIKIFVKDREHNAVRGAAVTVKVATKNAQHALSPVSSDLINDGEYTCTFQPFNVTQKMKYKLEISAAKAGFEPASVLLYIDVSPPLTPLPVCGIISPKNGGMLSGTAVFTGNSSTASGVIKLVQVQVSRDGLVRDKDWEAANGDYTLNGVYSWTYKIDTMKYENGFYRVYARSFNGSAWSQPAYVDIWIKNPEGDDRGLLTSIMIAVVAGSATAVFIAALSIRRMEMTRKKERR